jgi:Heavy metal binding domain
MTTMTTTRIALLVGALMLAPRVWSRQDESTTSIVWTCPLHREITESSSGRCSRCGRELVRTRVQRFWTCPLHAVVVKDAPGKCPVCGRDLYLNSREISYSCPMHPDVRELEPGSCPVCGMTLVEGSSARPHQDHNPKHGGTFFMAPDSWHHLEGTYPEDGLFRVYLYDNFSQPMRAAPFKGRAVLEETFDSTTRQTRELKALPLTASSDGTCLEARVGSGPSPREITAKIQFEPDGPFERFDFVFVSASAASSAPRAVDGGTTASSADVPAEGVSPAELASRIVARDGSVRELVDRGALKEVYVPALEAKDLALVLEARLSEAPESSRPALRWAVKELVSAAWLLDDFGDLGNREKVRAAFVRFHEAVEVIGSSYGVER